MEKVIFDTNTYRYLLGDKTNKQINKLIQKLKYRERKNNIEPLISPIVAKELLAHITNRKDKAFSKCLKAIKAQYYHSGDDIQYSMIPTPELLISKTFFGQEIDRKIETNKAIGQMLYHFAKNPSAYVFQKFQKNLNANLKHVQESELFFAEELLSFIKKIDPSHDDWKVFQNDEKEKKKVLDYIRSEDCSIQIAKGYLFIVHDLLIQENKISPIQTNELHDELDKKAKEFIKIFPEPISLFKLVLENILNSEFNIFENSRSNFVWDIHLMFNVGSNTIGSSKIIFVTSDKAIIRTALGTNPKNLVLTFDEYMECLGLK